MAQRRQSTFFPCRLRRHSSRNNKVSRQRPALRWARRSHPVAQARQGPRAGEPSIASGLSIAIEAAMVRARGREQRRTTMATIGTFKKSGNDYTGEIVTLSLQAKNVRIVPDATRSGDNAPSHRVMVGRVEIGAAWSKRSNEGRDYLGLKLDDPSFNAPIYANLFDDEDEGFSLIWSRPTRRNGE